MDILGRNSFGDIRAVFDGVEFTVPDDPANRHRQMIADWEAAGGIIPAASTPSLEESKSELKLRIDRNAEQQRLKYITPGAGQALTYRQKADEAKRFLSTAEPVASDFPLLSAEVGITAPTIAEVAAIVAAADAAWQLIGAEIEAARLGGKRAIDAAQSIEDAETAYAAVEWPSAS